ncbi:MAG: N-acetylmuramoyl-L-alanine amidase [Chitinivibrionales bacterium]|nr:N-acetylmuramoyl-L-alanine amidase [Chitinivibrionales bacterium]
MKKRILFKPCLAIVLLALAVPALTLFNALSNSKQQIQSQKINGITYVGLQETGAFLGFSCAWDMQKVMLTCKNNAVSVELAPDMTIARAGEKLIQCAFGPQLGHDGALLVSLADFYAIFSTLLPADSIAPADSAGVIRIMPLSVPKLTEHLKGEPGKPVLRAEMAPQENPPAATANKPATSMTGLAIRTVVIDPGHGGKDPGAIGPKKKINEKDVVLEIGLLLRELIKAKTNLTVYMTRETDVFIPLQDRTRFANEKKADIFVSIHANSIAGNAKKRNTTRGYKIYFLSQAKNEDDKLVAMAENDVIKLEDEGGKKHNYLQTILADMAGNEFLQESEDLSIQLDKCFEHSLESVPRLSRGIGQANFWVLNGAYMPAVLVETGFLSNEAEESLLNDRSFQKNMAAAILRAIIEFKKKYEAQS